MESGLGELTVRWGELKIRGPVRLGGESGVPLDLRKWRLVSRVRAPAT